MHRRSIEAAGVLHGSPIPAASRIGPLLWTSPISPYFPGTRDIPADLDTQFVNLFANMQAILAAVDATWDNIGKVEFFIADVDGDAFKKALAKHWLTHFPDPSSRPARHTIQVAKLMPNRAVMATFVAYIHE